MAENLFFGSLDHSKIAFCDFWMIPHDLVLLPKVKKHLVPSKYAISSRSNRPNSRKWPKTSILALWIIQKCIFVIFEWSSMSDIMAKLLGTFSIIKICNIKLIWSTKHEKTANDWMVHSKQPERVYLSHGKKSHGWSRFFPDMRFSRGAPRKALLSY